MLQKEINGRVEMTVNKSGAYELKHCGKIHRASDFSELTGWVKESRVTAEDSFRSAGSEEWISITAEPELAAILNPSNHWTVTMKSGVFKAHQFEMIVRWAEEGRITDDAVVEGPRTPPGGVSATALPALAHNLRKPLDERKSFPLLRIDGREYPAPDADAIRSWIRDSRVPVESEISLDSKNWEPVSSCGLFDLEDWPQAAHGRVEEELLPEMPRYQHSVSIETDVSVPVTLHEEAVGSGEDEESVFRKIQKGSSAQHTLTQSVNTPENNIKLPFTVVSGDSELAIESVAKLRALLKRREIYSYDELRQSGVTDGSTSVGEFLARSKKRKSPFYWIMWGLFVAASAVSALELADVLSIIPWF
jgi:hypothetical protein